MTLSFRIAGDGLNKTLRLVWVDVITLPVSITETMSICVCSSTIYDAIRIISSAQVGVPMNVSPILVPDWMLVSWRSRLFTYSL